MNFWDVLLAKKIGRSGDFYSDLFARQFAETGTQLTVSGAVPLSLPNAYARPLVSLTQFGKVAQASTPTPASPVEIKCNNGALRMVDSELPSAYRRLLGYSCDNNCLWQITNFHLRGSDTVRISFSVTAGCNVFGCYQGTSASDNYDLYVSTSSGAKYLRYGNGTYLSYWSASDLGNRFDVVYTPTGSSGMPQDSTWTEMTFEAENDLLIGSTTLTGTSAKLKGALYGDFIVDGRLHLVPCERISDGVLGYYDIIGEAFYEPTGTPTSLGYDGSKYSLQTVGTAEVLSVGGKNLNSGVIAHIGFTSTGASSTSDTFAGTGAIIPCSEGEKFTVSFGGFTTSGISGVFVNTWKTDGTFNLRQAISSVGVTTFTIPSGVNKVNFTLYKTGGATIDSTSWMQVERGASATPYEPYVVPRTASVVDLFSTGDSADTQDIIGGTVTRKIGIKVFTGEETIGTSNSTFTIAIPDRVTTKSTLVCSHFKYSTKTSSQTEDETIISFSSTNIGFRYDACANKDAFKAWLKAQFDKGTPVIVIYLLAEDVSESVSGQALSTTQGTNVISIDAEVSGIEVEAVYIGAGGE